MLLLAFAAGAQSSLSGTVSDADGNPLAGVSIFLQETQELQTSDRQGRFRFGDLKDGAYSVVFFAETFNTATRLVDLHGENAELNETLARLHYDLKAVEVTAAAGASGLRRLRNVEGTAIYAARKTEVIELENLVANLATNNARQVFKGIAGLNIWENDGGGLQLSIGARGLDPNRTSNFNTRQNGYDISADALGYPESYYTPPVQALQRIEIVRGAASLQYGPQFGGLLNFVFKKGPDKSFEFVTENTAGSFGLLSSFNSIGGTKNGWNYYAFYQRKQGEGWRPHSGFHQNTAYFSISKDIGDKLSAGIEYTGMNYLAQQPGGLQDFEFEQNPRQSKRARNWFKVNWNLAALTFDYRISDRTRLNSRTFFLDAQRQALGELGPINRPDPMRERDLIRGKYLNFGNETRLIHRFKTGNQPATFLAGVRYYKGFTRNQQGDANNGNGPDFEFLHPDDLERSEYEFPSKNVAAFAEQLFVLNPYWTITPGARFEYIRTASDGFYKERVYSGGQVIFERKFEDARRNSRSFLLLGIGVGRKLKEDVELYANFSQNYRSINFSDLAVVNPNLIVDSLLKDERGYNADLGLRGTLAGGAVSFDASLFYLHYRDRIGVGELVVSDPVMVEKSVAYRTNIGDARIAGVEAYAEADLWKLFNPYQSQIGFTVFTNFSLIDGIYLDGPSSVKGNRVELIPPFSIKTGATFRWKNLRAAYQFAFAAKQYSDATNAAFVVDATRGMVPAYSVQDLSLSYAWRRFRFQAGVNNLTDARYFTRRAAAYPGPGIIPADGRSIYGTVSFRW